MTTKVIKIKADKKKIKRQFRTKAKKRTFFDRGVRPQGYTRVVSMGKIIPKGWTYVRITPIKREGNIITVTFERLLGENNHAQTSKDNQKRQ